MQVVAKVWYLSCIMQYPLYGCTLFPAAYKGYWPHAGGGGAITLGVSGDGLLVVKPEDNKAVLFEFPYREVESVLLDPNDNFVTVNLTRSSGGESGDRQRVHVFETAHKAAIGSLVAAYCPSLADGAQAQSHAGGGNPGGGRRRVKQVTNEDRMRLHQNLVSARRALVDSGILKKPCDDGAGFFKNTLRRLSTKKLDRYRAEAVANEQGEVYKGFSHAYWAFARQPLPQTLSLMPMANPGQQMTASAANAAATASDPHDEQLALEVFQLILTYAGLAQQQQQIQQQQLQKAEENIYSSREEEDHVLLIQTVLDKAMKKDCLVNELFLQLIKQTTDHPEPNSRVNLRHWSLVALACSVILPVERVVRKYLLAHLKRCSADFVTEEGKYARFAEKVITESRISHQFADFKCPVFLFQCFHKTLGTRRRQWPPSKQEILCTINRRPIYARFHFMDGQFHAVEFDPSATAQEVLRLVRAKIGLREDAPGYAIYEVLGTQVRQGSCSVSKVHKQLAM